MQASHKLTTELFTGGGEMGERMRSLDWSGTALGAPANWPKSLRTAVRMLLGTGYPMYIAWGPEFVQFYNDAYRPILGNTKHPAALGKGTPETFQEIWDFIGPMFRRVLAVGEATTLVDQSLFFDRRGYVEENYFTFSYSPIPDDDESTVGGVLVTVIETTEKVLEQRRLRTLKDLAAKAGESRGEKQVWQSAAETIATNPSDVPFALLYRYDASRREAILEGMSGFREPSEAAPARIGPDDHSWPLLRAEKEPAVLTDLKTWFGKLPAGAWMEAPGSAVLMPISAPGEEAPVGFLVAGLNPHKRYEADYQLFLERVAAQISRSITEARAYEAERRRAEALAELDRAKTTFFTNISHEFRTPLTLILGPLEQTLLRGDSLAEDVRERLEMAHRNTLRLLKLVNNLLDFSRIEAGRVQAVFEPTDVAKVTSDLVSGFRSACERAGLILSVTTEPIDEPVYIDGDMWEKIVLNLLSNAFKFTLQGGIAVEVRQKGNFAEVSVADTGTGIPASELPHLFERFHRVEGTRGRSYEGSGIGLALVQELVKLHGGTISVVSKESVGTRFTVRIPTGVSHIAPENLGKVRQSSSTATRIESFVHEAMRWMPEESGTESSIAFNQEDTPTAHTEAVRGQKVLVVDDNADMREYAARLLRDHFTVQTASDGEQALELITRDRPDLVLSDVMMPGMDGLALLEAIRTDPNTRALPVILLSARAGEESRVEGLVSGADDYLTKPFTARELLARVTAHLEIAAVRQMAENDIRESEERFRSLVEQSPVSTVVYDKQGHVVECNEAFSRLWGIRVDDLPPDYSVLHDPQLEALGILPDVRKAFSGHAIHMPTFHYDLAKTTTTKIGATKWIEVVMYPVRNTQREITNVVVLHTDVTARVEAEQALALTEQRAERESKRVREVLESTSDAVFMLARNWDFTYLNEHAVKLLANGRDLLGKNIWQEFPDATGREFWKQYHRAMNERVIAEFEEFYPEPLNCWYNVRAYPTEEGIAVFFHDVTERKRAEHALRQSEKLAAAGRLAASISHEINNPLEAVTNLLYLLDRSTSLTESEHSYLKTAQAELDRVSQIATQTLRFYRQSTRPSETQLSEVLDGVIELFKPRLHDAGIQVKRDFRETKPITAFVGELRQVFTNIIANAMDATRPGGTISVRAREGHDWSTGAPGIRVTIADSGQGMSAETIRHMFEPFFTTKGVTGTGLGLWVSHEILEKHKSVVNVRSSQDKAKHGTTFSILFPFSGIAVAA